MKLASYIQCNAKENFPTFELLQLAPFESDTVISALRSGTDESVAGAVEVLGRLGIDAVVIPEDEFSTFSDEAYKAFAAASKSVYAGRVESGNLVAVTELPFKRA